LFYTPDGRSLGTVSSSGLGVSIWDAATGRRLRRLEGYRAVLSPDGKTLATVYHSGIIQLKDFRDGRELSQIVSKNGESFDRLAFSPDGKTLVALSLKHAAEWKTDAALVGYETEGLTERFRRPGDFSKTRALVFAPDGKTLAMANPDRPDHPGFSMQEPDRSWIRLIDPQDGSEIRRITIDRFDVASLAFSPDGRTLAAGVSDRTVRLYDPATGEEQRPRLGEDHAMPTPKVGERPIKWYENAARAASALAFSPDGKILVSGQESVGYLNGRVDEASITVWDVPKRQELHRAFGHYGGINGLAFAPDGKTFASCGGDIAAKVWDASTGRETDPRPGHRATPHLLAVSPKDGTVFTGGSFDKVVLSWNPATGQCLGTAVDVPAGVLTLDVSPDGLSLLIDTWDGLTLWDLATRREIRRFSGKRPSHSGFYRAAFSPDGKSVTMELKVWETATGRQLASFLDKQPDWPVVNSHYLCTRYTPDSQQLVSVETKGIRILDIPSKSVAAIPVRRDFADPTRAAVSPDGRLVAVGNHAQMQAGFPSDAPDLPVRVYEVATGRQVFALEGHTDQITSLAFSPDGKTLATAAGDHWHPKDKTIRIWDTADGRELRRIDVAKNGARQVAYLPSGRAIVSLGMDGVATVWDIAEIIPKR
jgi:WD40 repeat protein